MRVAILAALLFSSLTHYGQEQAVRIKRDLTEIKTIEHAEEYLADHSDVIGHLIKLNSKTDSTEFERDLLSKQPGEVITINSIDSTFVFKILESKSVKLFRVQYIFLDNSKLNLKQIDSLRTLIKKKLVEGSSFDELASKFSMDGNAKRGGDLGWFEEEQMNKKFEDAIKAHALGDVFNVDIEKEQWYYVVKNSYNPKVNQKMTIVFFALKK